MITIAIGNLKCHDYCHRNSNCHRDQTIMIVVTIFSTVLLAIVMTLSLHDNSNYDNDISFYYNHYDVLRCHDICHDRDSLARHDDYHGGCQGVLVVMTMITKNSAATTNIVMGVMEFQLSCDDRDKFCSHDECHGGCYGISIVVTNMTNFAVVMNIMVNVVMAFRLS